MEVTKWLKPSISVSRIGDGASVQAATRVNAEQASKRTMCRPTRLPYRGTAGLEERRRRPDATPGYWRQHVHKESARNTGKPQGVVKDDQPEAREGQAGRLGVAERFAVPLKPVNAGGGSSRQTQDVRNLGKMVSGIARDDAISWTLGRQRSGPSIL
jgi:hypothetical protein